MAYDEAFAERIRGVIGPRPDVNEIKMFGGLCFTAGGNMFGGIAKGELMVRVDKSQYESLLARPGARPMEFTGRPMAGMLFVAAEVIETDDALATWVQEAYDYASKLPVKVKKAPRATAAKAKR